MGVDGDHGFCTANTALVTNTIRWVTLLVSTEHAQDLGHVQSWC